MYEVNWRINDSFVANRWITNTSLDRWKLVTVSTNFRLAHVEYTTRSIVRGRSIRLVLLNLLSITGYIERSKSFVLLTIPPICHRCRKILLVSCSLIRDFLLANRHSIIPLEKPSKFSKRPSILCCELHNSVHNSVLTFEKNGRFSLKDAINFVKLHRFKKIRRVEVMKSRDDGCLKNEIMARL